MNNENFVRLVGYCAENGLRAVAYELAPRGSLHDILHGMSGSNFDDDPVDIDIF